MNLITKTARRLLRKPQSRPVPPVPARDCYPSMIFSLDDQVPKPTPRLFDISLSAIHHIVEGRVDLADIASRPNVPHWFTLWPGEHYMLLAALMLTLRPRLVIEIGTFTGLSALTLKKYLPPTSRLVTFDLLRWHTLPDTVFVPDDFADQRLTQCIGDLSDPAVFEQHRSLLEAADFFFIDAPKDNRFEYQLMDHLRTVQFHQPPILLFDDTRLWSMLRFWRLLPYPKLDLTSFGSWSGTGLVDWIP
ncbi:MAG: methyltransferase [Bacillota bacterium]